MPRKDVGRGGGVGRTRAAFGGIKKGIAQEWADRLTGLVLSHFVKLFGGD